MDDDSAAHFQWLSTGYTSYNLLGFCEISLLARITSRFPLHCSQQQPLTRFWFLVTIFETHAQAIRIFPKKLVCILAKINYFTSNNFVQKKSQYFLSVPAVSGKYISKTRLSSVSKNSLYYCSLPIAGSTDTLIYALVSILICSNFCSFPWLSRAILNVSVVLYNDTSTFRWFN